MTWPMRGIATDSSFYGCGTGYRPENLQAHPGLICQLVWRAIFTTADKIMRQDKPSNVDLTRNCFVFGAGAEIISEK